MAVETLKQTAEFSAYLNQIIRPSRDEFIIKLKKRKRETIDYRMENQKSNNSIKEPDSNRLLESGVRRALKILFDAPFFKLYIS